MNFVQAGLVAQNTGNLKDGIPYIVAALNELSALSSHKDDLQRTHQEMIKFLLTRSDDELKNLLSIAHSRTLALAQQ